MSYLSKRLGGFSWSLKEEVTIVKKQGIVSILGSDVETTNSVASLRRTLSADMSTKKWQAQHGFYALKRIASSKELNVSITDSSPEEEECEETCKDNERIWKSIQEDKRNKEPEKASRFDIWSSIVSREKQDDSNLPPTYVHPLVKRTTSSLSEKSLEICTESLGSETGSDGFSSYPASETGEVEEDKEVEQVQVAEKAAAEKHDMEDFRVERYNSAAASKKPRPRSFPPPISSLSQRDGASVHMKSHRDNGRLVLQVVSVLSQKNFHAQRQDGRLVLTFINEEENEQKDYAEQFDVEIERSEGEKEYEEEEEEDEEEKELEAEFYKQLRDTKRRNGEGGGEKASYVMQRTPKLSTGDISVHRLALVMNKPLPANRNPTWSIKFNEVVKSEDGEEVFQPVTPPLTQSLPPRPPVGRLISSPPPAVAATATAKAAASFNPCEYFWKPKPMAAAAAASAVPITQKLASLPGTNDKSIPLSKSLMSKEQQELVVLRGHRGDYNVPSLEGWKEPRRVLFWKPHCIATS